MLRVDLARARLLASIVSIALISAACVSPHSADRFVVVTSPNFEILSSMAAEDSKALAVELERFDALIHAVTNATRRQAVVPTRIYAFRSMREYQRFGHKDSLGFMSAALRENWIVVSDYSSDYGASEIIFHEYVHHVLRARGTARFPIWYDEGFAELLSTARTHEQMMAIGAVPSIRINSFRYGNWLSMNDVVSATSLADFSSGDAAMFYAQAWALMHYLALDRDQAGSDLVGEFHRYANLVELGLSAPSAFEDAFGESPSELGSKIRGMLARGDLRIVGFPITALEYDRSEPSVRPASAEEVARRLGHLYLATGGTTEAREHFEAALALDPLDARAHAGLGGALSFEGRSKEAEIQFARAIELAPEDALIHLDSAEHWDRVARAQRMGPTRREALAAARRAYELSLSLDSAMPETWAMLGGTYLAAGEDPELAIAPLQRALFLLPGSPQVLRLLAEAYFAVGEVAEARRILTRESATRTHVGAGQSVDERILEIRKSREAALARAQGRRTP